MLQALSCELFATLALAEQSVITLHCLNFKQSLFKLFALADVYVLFVVVCVFIHVASFNLEVILQYQEIIRFFVLSFRFGSQLDSELIGIKKAWQTTNHTIYVAPSFNETL